jgi:hypothetical protein
MSRLETMPAAARMQAAAGALDDGTGSREQIDGWPLSQVTHAWKSFTAKAINRALGRQGLLWAPEYYDRFMRDDGQFQATRGYIEMNPVSAKLCATPEAWRWSSASANTSS